MPKSRIAEALSQKLARDKPRVPTPYAYLWNQHFRGYMPRKYLVFMALLVKTLGSTT
jgi:hypothetical protein